MSDPRYESAFPTHHPDLGSTGGLTKLEWAAVTIAAEMHANDRRWQDPSERQELAERAVGAAKAGTREVQLVIAYMYDGEKLVDWMRVERHRAFVERIHPDDMRLGRVVPGGLVEGVMQRVQRFNRVGRTDKYQLEQL